MDTGRESRCEQHTPHAPHGVKPGGAFDSDGSNCSSPHSSAASSGSSGFSLPPAPCSADFGSARPDPQSSAVAMVPLQHQSEAMQQDRPLFSKDSAWAAQSVEHEKHCEPAPRHAPQLALSMQDIVANHQLSLIQTRINWGHQLKLHRASSDGQWRAATGIRVDGSIEEETVEGMVAVLAQLTTTPLGTPVEKVTAWKEEAHDRKESSHPPTDFLGASRAGDDLLAARSFMQPAPQKNVNDWIARDPSGTTTDRQSSHFNTGCEAGAVSSGDNEIAWPPGIAHLRPPDSPRLTVYSVLGDETSQRENFLEPPGRDLAPL